MATQEPDAESADGLSVSIDVDEEGFERSLLEHVESEVIAPRRGIDIAVEGTTLESIDRQDDGSYRLSLVVEGSPDEGGE